jgi:hypothetical protein
MFRWEQALQSDSALPAESRPRRMSRWMTMPRKRTGGRLARPRAKRHGGAMAVARVLEFRPVMSIPPMAVSS